MPVNFAMPILHQTSADYTFFANALVVGQPFQQPVLSAPSTANASSGLEIFIDPQNLDAHNIYAFLNGALSWELSNMFVFEDRLILQTNSTVLRGLTGLKALNMVEASPASVVYGNPDVAGTQAALETLLTDAHSQTFTTARRASWHPSMRMPVRVNGVEIFLKRYLDAFIPASTEITRLVTDFLAGTASALLKQIPVRAGELIGRAAPYTVLDPLPVSAPFTLGIATDPDRARRLTFITEDHCGQRINPLFYLHTFMNRMLLPARDRIVTSLTNITGGGNLAHPLVDLFPPLAGAARPAGRVLIGGQSLIPLGHLTTFHEFPNTNPVSQLSWHYTTQSVFEAITLLPTGGPVVPRMTPNASEINRVDTLWTNHGAAIAAIAEACQIPCEIIVALITTEALPTLDERDVRLKPLLRGDRARLRSVRAAAPLELEYDLTVGTHGTVANFVDIGNGSAAFDITLDNDRTFGANVLTTSETFILWGSERLVVTSNSGSATPTRDYRLTIRSQNSGAAIAAETEAWLLEGHSPPSPGVPNPWNGSALVRAGASALTWDDLVAVVDATNGQRIGAGLLHTLISPLLQNRSSPVPSVVPWINDAIPGIFATLGIPSPPATAGAYLNDWLLHGAHSILIGAAYIRLGYNHPASRNGTITEASCFDLPLVAAVYDAGAAIPAPNTLWGLRVSNDYVERAGPSFNAAVDKFNNAVPPVPNATVRFME